MAAPSSPPIVRPFAVTLLLLSSATLAFSLWANLSWEIQDPRYLRFIPPFIEGVDRNMNKHLGAEYLSIAQAIVKGRGFSDPFQVESGPTAWMPPMLCWIEAMFLWLFQGDLELLMVAMIILQNFALICTAWLLLALLGGSHPAWVGLVFLMGIWGHFRYSFQMTHDCGYLMLMMNGVLAGFAFFRPLSSLWRAAAWGLFGGWVCLSSPIIGFVWVVLGWLQSRGQKRHLLLAWAVMLVLISPWVVRNYLVFGKFIPVKSNLAYELFQSQCLQERGMLDPAVFVNHPWGHDNETRREYIQLGETAFLAKIQSQFLEALSRQPLEYVRKVGERFLGVTLLYHPENPFQENRHPLWLLLTLVLYPLPFVAWCILLAKGWRMGWTQAESLLFWSYVLYFLPYILISYYSRYEFPALPIKWGLIIWLGQESFGLLRRKLDPLVDDPQPGGVP